MRTVASTTFLFFINIFLILCTLATVFFIILAFEIWSTTCLQMKLQNHIRRTSFWTLLVKNANVLTIHLSYYLEENHLFFVLTNHLKTDKLEHALHCIPYFEKPMPPSVILLLLISSCKLNKDRVNECDHQLSHQMHEASWHDDHLCIWDMILIFLRTQTYIAIRL